MSVSTDLNKPENVPRVAVIGGGLVGALNTCFFAKRGWYVDLYESRKDIRQLEHVPGRSINLTLSTRAREALKQVGLEDRVLGAGVPLYARFVHDPDGVTKHHLPYSWSGQYNVSINRQLLNEILLSEAETYPNVRIFFQHKLQDCELETEELVFERLTDKEDVIAATDLICGCDGAFSALRRSLLLEPGFDYSQEYIAHGYIELHISSTKEGQYKLDPNVFHLWPRGDFLMIALANKNSTFTVTLFAPWTIFDNLNADTEENQQNLIQFFEANFPDAVPLIGREEIVERFVHVKPSGLLSIKCKPHHYGQKIILLGDAAHAMVPFYGQGMNCIRHLVNHAGLRFRKKLDFFLNTLFPNSWIPMYSMVTFSRMRYHQVKRDRAWQDKILGWICWFNYCLLTSGFILTAFWASRKGKLQPRKPKISFLKDTFGKMY